MTVRLSPLAKRLITLTVSQQCSTGFICFYTGSPPTNVGDTLDSTTQQLVAEIRLQGFSTYNEITSSLQALPMIPEDACLLTGTIGWARLLDNNREVLLDTIVSTNYADDSLKLSVVEASVGAPLDLTTFGIKIV